MARKAGQPSSAVNALAKPAQALCPLHAGEIELNDRQGDAGSKLSQEAGKLPEIPASQHPREMQAMLDDVQQPRSAQRAFICDDRYMVVS